MIGDVKKDYFCSLLLISRGREPQKLFIMPVKIRLQRHGKREAFYWVVAADLELKRW